MKLSTNLKKHLVLAGNLLTENTYVNYSGNCIYYATSFASFLRYFPEDLAKIQDFTNTLNIKFTQQEIKIKDWITPHWYCSK